VQHEQRHTRLSSRIPASRIVSAILVALVPLICSASFPTGGWSGDWSVEIRPEGCSLETSFKDITAEADPSIDPRTYITNDPFRLYLQRSETAFSGMKGAFPPGTLFLWLQPQVWDPIAEHQRDIAGVAIGTHRFELHRPAAQPEWRFFHLAGAAANSVYDELIADRKVELVIRTERGEVLRREIPLANGKASRFRTLSKMFEACYQDRN
jgi:hypothetical protein